VVWSDDRTGAGDIRGARVTNAGAVLDAVPGVTVTSAANAETQPDIAASSGALLVSYQNLASAGNPDVYAQRTNLSLQPIGTAIPLATTAAPEQDAKVASNGSGYLVVWGGTGDIQGRRVLPDGSLPGAALIPISTAPDNQSLPDVAFNGAYLVAWKDNRNFWNEIWAARVASDGTVQDPSGFRIFDQATNEGTAAIQSPPSVAPGPGNKWAVDHEAVFGGIFHYSVAPK
jgi:large repetitive protein